MQALTSVRSREVTEQANRERLEKERKAERENKERERKEREKEEKRRELERKKRLEKERELRAEKEKLLSARAERNKLEVTCCTCTELYTYLARSERATYPLLLLVLGPMLLRLILLQYYDTAVNTVTTKLTTAILLKWSTLLY